MSLAPSGQRARDPAVTPSSDGGEVRWIALTSAAPHAEPTPHAVSLCVALVRDRELQRWHLVEIDRTPFACGYFGCIADSEGRPRELLVVWTECHQSAGESTPEREVATNAVVESSWEHAWRAWPDLPGLRGLVRTQWSRSPAPLWLLDPERNRAETMVDSKSGMPLEVCRRDDLLRSCGLASFASSTARFAVLPSAEGNAVVRLSGRSEDAPDIPNWKTRVQRNGEQIEFNVTPSFAGGRIVATHFPELTLSEFLRVLDGSPAPDLQRLPPAARRTLEQQRSTPARFGRPEYLAPSDLQRCAVESLAIRLRLVAEIAAELRSAFTRTQTPFLNLTSDSIGIELPGRGGFPSAWNAMPLIARPSGARRRRFRSAQLEVFESDGEHADAYVPPRPAHRVFRATIRVRTMHVVGEGRAIVEGQLQPTGVVALEPSELLRFELRTTAGETVEILAKCTGRTVGGRPVQFQSLPTVLAGRSEHDFPDVTLPVEVVLREGPPHDLYALSVIALATLCAGARQHDLRKVSDDLDALASRAGVESDVALPARIRAAWSSDEYGSLAPRLPTWLPRPPFEREPLGLPRGWFEVLAAVIQLRPGAVPESHCDSLQAFSESHLALAFDGPVESLSNLATRWRESVLGVDGYRELVSQAIAALRPSLRAES